MAKNKAKANDATPGFAIKITDDTELGSAMLIAEMGDGSYEPVGVVISINEAREVAEHDFNCRTRALENGMEPACPEHYVVWARGLGGEFRVAARIEP